MPYDFDLRYPQYATDTEIRNLRLIHDSSRVEFPELKIIESRSEDRGIHDLLFGPKGDKGLDLKESPFEFTALFDNTWMKYIPVEVTDRAYFNLLFTRDKVPFRTMFNAEISDITGTFWGDHNPDDVEDGLVSVTFSVIYLCGRAPDSYPSEAFLRLNKVVWGKITRQEDQERTQRMNAAIAKQARASRQSRHGGGRDGQD